MSTKWIGSKRKQSFIVFIIIKTYDDTFIINASRKKRKRKLAGNNVIQTLAFLSFIDKSVQIFIFIRKYLHLGNNYYKSKLSKRKISIQ